MDVAAIATAMASAQAAQTQSAMAAKMMKMNLDAQASIVETYVGEDVKLPWYIDLLNINLNNTDLVEARRRIQLMTEAFRKDGTRITENLDF